MELKLNELTGKFKALNFVLKKVDEAVTAREKGILRRIEASLSNKINGIYSLKEEIEEFKFISEESEADVETYRSRRLNRIGD